MASKIFGEVRKKGRTTGVVESSADDNDYVKMEIAVKKENNKIPS